MVEIARNKAKTDSSDDMIIFDRIDICKHVQVYASKGLRTKGKVFKNVKNTTR